MIICFVCHRSITTRDFEEEDTFPVTILKVMLPCWLRNEKDKRTVDGQRSTSEDSAHCSLTHGNMHPSHMTVELKGPSLSTTQSTNWSLFGQIQMLFAALWMKFLVLLRVF